MFQEIVGQIQTFHHLLKEVMVQCMPLTFALYIKQMQTYL
jgi:hypothetical protein